MPISFMIRESEWKFASLTGAAYTRRGEAQTMVGVLLATHQRRREAYTLADNLFRPVTDGFGQGEDARDIDRRAMEWWHSVLSRIEAQLGAAEE